MAGVQIPLGTSGPVTARCLALEALWEFQNLPPDASFLLFADTDIISPSLSLH